MLLRVGLTGSIGAGKSTVAGMLRQRGCHVVDLDAIGHLQLRASGESFDDVVAAFGRGVVGPDGGIDRGALAAIVFHDAAARRRLEAILHPRIAAAEERELRDRDGIAVSEAALLIETGGWRRYHRLVVVVAEAASRADRLVQRGMSAAQIRAREGAQLPQADKVAVADYLVDNSGDLAGTESQVDALMTCLTEDLDALRQGRELPPRPRR